MRKKAFSIVFVPHSKSSSKTLAVSKSSIRIVAGGACLFVLLLAGFLVDYLTMSHARSSYKRLLKENQAQAQTLKEYETTVDRLKKNVNDFELYAKKLNVMAGLKADGIKEVGIGDGNSEVQGGLPQVLTPPKFSIENINGLNQKAQDLGKNLSTLVIFFENQKARLASTPTIWPTVGWVVSYFGPRLDPFTDKPTFHYGMDITTNEGGLIVAPAGGIVVQIKNGLTTGNMILLSHGLDISTAYFHLSKFMVREGQRVRRGDVIGLVGRTGKALGPHLHYEVRINGQPVNPVRYILEE
ncbi:MAG: M23 family metallopeptidase [Candidatus Aminicenantes bacterium]|nr:M23 family metallopeptidase [Candidatus Aminicenantes bacterium]